MVELVWTSFRVAHYLVQFAEAIYKRGSVRNAGALPTENNR